jgi:hypothetical protein
MLLQKSSFLFIRDSLIIYTYDKSSLLHKVYTYPVECCIVTQ